jgi:hypothetical protein
MSIVINNIKNHKIFIIYSLLTQHVFQIIWSDNLWLLGWFIIVAN